MALETGLEQGTPRFSEFTSSIRVAACGRRLNADPAALVEK